jgi:hypothetical protein
MVHLTWSVLWYPPITKTNEVRTLFLVIFFFSRTTTVRGQTHNGERDGMLFGRLMAIFGEIRASINDIILCMSEGSCLNVHLNVRVPRELSITTVIIHIWVCSTQNVEMTISSFLYRER